MRHKVNRAIQRRKFYATQPAEVPLPQRLDDLHLRVPWHEPKHPGSPE